MPSQMTPDPRVSESLKGQMTFTGYEQGNIVLFIRYRMTFCLF